MSLIESIERTTPFNEINGIKFTFYLTFLKSKFASRIFEGQDFSIRL